MLLPQQSALSVRSELTALSEVLAWFDQFNGFPLSQRSWLQCQLILAEGFTNAVRHAHRDRSPDTLIKIEVVLTQELLEIRIWDQGPPFDLLHTLKSLPSEPDQNAEGGRGLRLMQQIADRLSYTRTLEGQNCLLMAKYHDSIPEEGGHPPQP